MLPTLMYRCETWYLTHYNVKAEAFSDGHGNNTFQMMILGNEGISIVKDFTNYTLY